MEHEGLIEAGSDGNPIHLYCISMATIPIINFLINDMLWSFRFRRIDGMGGCTPDSKMRQYNEITHIPAHNVPSTEWAANCYRAQGGNLTDEQGCGVDPIGDFPDLVARRNELFEQGIQRISDIVSDLNCGEGNLYRQHILNYIDLTLTLAQEIRYQ
jgi:hypothetical protein